MSYLNEPLVSVIIPTCDRPTLLKRAVKSVIRQTYSNFEIIIVDDSIKSSAKEILKSFFKKKIKYIRLNQHSGASVARNVGIRIGKGDFISFLDDDDEYLPNFLEDLVQPFQNYQNVQMVIGTVMVYERKENIKFKAKIPIKEGFLRELIPLPCYILINSFILRKESIIDFDTSLPYYEDVDFIIRLAKRGVTFIYVDTSVAFCYDEPQINRVTDFTKRDVEIGEILIKRHKDFLMKWPLYYAGILFSHSRKLYLYGGVSKTFFFLKDVLPTAPFSLKHWLAFVSIFIIRIVKFLFRFFSFHRK